MRAGDLPVAGARSPLMAPWLSSLIKRLFGRERSYVAHDDGRKIWLTCGDCGRVIYVGRSGVFEGLPAVRSPGLSRRPSAGGGWSREEPGCP